MGEHPMFMTLIALILLWASAELQSTHDCSERSAHVLQGPSAEDSFRIRKESTTSIDPKP